MATKILILKKLKSMNSRIQRLIVSGCVAATLLLSAITTEAQEKENEYQTRAFIDLSFKPIKKLKLSLLPELRFDENFSLDKYLIEGEAEYKALKFLFFGASYGFIGNLRNIKDTEYFSRYAFYTTLKKDFDRFEPSFRFMYSNYADDEKGDKNFLRYKASLKYDIANCKITPFVAVQAFQQLNDGGMYKMRYAAGADYKLFKKNYISANYKLDNYQNKNKNRHMVCVGYKLKF